jgi:hypothetical protein
MPTQEPLEPSPTLGQWQWPEILVIPVQQIEAEDPEPAVLARHQSQLKTGEVRCSNAGVTNSSPSIITVRDPACIALHGPRLG